VSTNTTQPIVSTPRAPGLSIAFLGSDAGPVTVGADTTVFLGFRDPAAVVDPHSLVHGGVSIVRMTQWSSPLFHASLPVGEHSYLREAIRGYFANGGRCCLIMTVSAVADETTRIEALLAVLRPDSYLAGMEEVAFVVAPDIHCPQLVPADRVWDLQAAILDHCRACGDRFAILDAPRLQHGIDPLQALTAIVWPPRNEFGAMYFPWLLADRSSEAAVSGFELSAAAQWRCLNEPVDQLGAHRGKWVPPSGHVAGLYCRLGAASGRYCAPANEPLFGVLDTSCRLSVPQRALLNQAQLNCIITRAGLGVQVMGERTLSGHARLAFVSSVLLVIGLRRWLRTHMLDFVFESQTTDLWDRIRRTLIAHCQELWRANALAGNSADEAFFVQCDAESNPPEAQERGEVVAIIRLAPAVPAEFIEIEVVHDASGFSVRGP
jgi:uncharacterized protein